VIAGNDWIGFFFDGWGGGGGVGERGGSWEGGFRKEGIERIRERIDGISALIATTVVTIAIPQGFHSILISFLNSFLLCLD